MNSLNNPVGSTQDFFKLNDPSIIECWQFNMHTLKSFFTYEAHDPTLNTPVVDYSKFTLNSGDATLVLICNSVEYQINIKIQMKTVDQGDGYPDIAIYSDVLNLYCTDCSVGSTIADPTGAI